MTSDLTVKCRHCGHSVYLYEGRWRHTNGFYTCIIPGQKPGLRAEPEAPVVRDPSRIPGVLHELGAYWIAHPDLRLGQILGNLKIGYYTDDDVLLERLEERNND